MENPASRDEDAEQQARRRARGISTNDKYNAIMKHLRGESRTAIAEELGVSVDRLTRWENTFIKAGLEALAASGHMAVKERAREKRRNLLVTLAVAVLIAFFAGLVYFVKFD